jgi:TRAP-type C4-dicarboxylate transport system permease small subunit
MNAYLLTLPIPIGYSYMVLPFTGLLIALFSLVKGTNRVLKHYTKKKKGATV